MIRHQKNCSTKAVHVKRAAFTLLELLLVLLLIVAVLAISWPALTRRMGQNDLRESAMELAHALTETRLSAMESGEPWALRFEPQSGRYVSLPLSECFAEPSALIGMNAPSFPQQEPVLDQGTLSASAFGEGDGWGTAGISAAWRTLPHEAQISTSNHRQVQSQSGLGADRELAAEDDEFLQALESTESDAFDSNDLGEGFNSTNSHYEWIVFDSMGRTVDCRLLVTLPKSEWELEVAIRGVTGGVSLASPRRRSSRVEPSANEVSFEAEPMVGGMEAWQ